MYNLLIKLKIKHIILIALIVRLVAVLFSKGFGWSDDQFEVIEVSHSWVRGWNYWLNDGKPSVHSVVYPGINYLILWGCEALGLTDAQAKMYVVRLLHALFSLITVYLGYKITAKISDEITAKKVGLILAIGWLFPFISVRTLIEWVCVPFCMYSFWITLQAEENNKKSLWLWAGFWIGVAFGIRLMALIFGGGVGLVLLYRKQLLSAIIYGIGILAGMFALQGIVDWAVWGNPIASTYAYFEYNATHHGDYPQNNPFTFTLVLLGLFIPPMGLFFFYGFLKTWKKHLILFLPALAFLLFHSLFPNRQERFIFPMLPLYTILAVVGWENFYQKSSFWNKNQNLYKIITYFTFTVNAILLGVLSLSYVKKSRVEPWSILAKKGDVRAIIIHTLNREDYLATQFYLNEQHIIAQKSFDLRHNITEIQAYDRNLKPNYILFITDEKLNDRLKQMRSIYPHMKLLEVVEPGFVDQIAHRLNPKNNHNFVVYIYQTGT
jgi:hypothetical protein